jgi:hypothetical protein
MAQKNQVRESQAITTYGTGSIIDVPFMSLMALSPDYQDLSETRGYATPQTWGGTANRHRQVEDKRLSKYFPNTDFFVRPPLDTGAGMGIPVNRFPSSMFCPVCTRIYIEDQAFYEQAVFLDSNNKHLNDRNEAYFCPDCFLGSAKRRTRNKLVPSRFIIATVAGHIDDFPWLWFVTRNSPDKEALRKQKNPVLKLVNKGQSASISDLEVFLYQPGKTDKPLCRNNLGEIFNTSETGQSTLFNDKDDSYLSSVGYTMPLPWKGRDQQGRFLRSGVKDDTPRALQRGAGNVYFPILWSSIRLPDKIAGGIYSPLAQKLLEQREQVLTELEAKIELLGLADTEAKEAYFLEKFIPMGPKIVLPFKTRLLKALDLDLDHKMEEFTDELLGRIIRQCYRPVAAPESPVEETEDKALLLRKEEFDCFLCPHEGSDDIWYKSVILDSKLYTGKLAGVVQQVVLLEKLNELRVFRGFTRVMPLLTQDLIFGIDENASIPESTKKVLVREYNRIQDPRRDPSDCNFLPATEVRGEGIFIRFRSDVLLSWEKKEQVEKRYRKIRKHQWEAFKKRAALNGQTLVQDDSTFKSKSARYILLHTLAHQLIRELSMESGYNAASLREIIYCGETGDEMDGILIYTAASDAEGTMGGLVALGKPDSLERIMEQALRNSEWCSSDPLCLDSQGQGFQALNLAACHACCLLPETSCEAMNGFLDRGMIHGTLNDPAFGFASLMESKARETVNAG